MGQDKESQLNQDELNEKLRQVEVELGDANYELSRVIESEEDYDTDEFQEKINSIMETITHLQNKYALLLQTF